MQQRAESTVPQEHSVARRSEWPAMVATSLVAASTAAGRGKRIRRRSRATRLQHFGYGNRHRAADLTTAPASAQIRAYF